MGPSHFTGRCCCLTSVYNGLNCNFINLCALFAYLHSFSIRHRLVKSVHSYHKIICTIEPRTSAFILLYNCKIVTTCDGNSTNLSTNHSTVPQYNWNNLLWLEENSWLFDGRYDQKKADLLKMINSFFKRITRQIELSDIKKRISYGNFPDKSSMKTMHRS